MRAAEEQTWRSADGGCTIGVLRYGQAGAPLLWVPTSGGDRHEFAAHGLDEVAAHWIEAGRLQIFAIDGHGPQTLFDDGALPAERIARYAAFERALVEELLPWIGARTAGEPLAVGGASYGAFVAANLWLKRPQRVQLACGLGGVYGLWHRLAGHHDRDVFLHTPLEYLPCIEDAAVLAALRAGAGIDLFAAEHDPWLDSTRRFAQLLAQQELPHRLEIWPAPADHHEHWWRLQLARFLERHCG